MHLKGIAKKLNNIVSDLKKRMSRTTVAWIAACVCIVVGAVTIGVVSGSSSSFVVYMNGDAICRVDSKSDVDEAVLLLDKMHEDYGITDTAECDITYRCKLSNLPLLDASECAQRLYEECAQNYSRAYAVSVEGISIGLCATYDEAQKVVDSFREYIVDGLTDTENRTDLIKLTTEFEISSVICRTDSITTAEDICRLLLNSKEHYGSSLDGDSSERIPANGSLSLLYADKNYIFGMVKNEAETLLPDLDFSFNMGELNSSIQYVTYVVEEYSEIIPYETVYIETDELYVGQSKVEFSGENGIAENIYEIAYADGVEVSRTLISSAVICEAENRIEYVGTKEYPSTDPTGSFMWPIQKKFVITSVFGENREGLDAAGTYHKALDLAGIPIGTPVYAADGGTVTYVGTNGNYGLLVKITHEDGVETRYAHLKCSDVKVGDKVYKGQKIAEVGMTGRTTGPHLHFEVRLNGTVVDPQKYLPKTKPWQ